MHQMAISRYDSAASVSPEMYSGTSISRPNTAAIAMPNTPADLATIFLKGPSLSVTANAAADV